jgi:hypothetical protein
LPVEQLSVQCPSAINRKWGDTVSVGTKVTCQPYQFASLGIRDFSLDVLIDQRTSPRVQLVIPFGSRSVWQLRIRFAVNPILDSLEDQIIYFHTGRGGAFP